MRVNLPVTQQEYDFPDGRTLLSTTDTKGRITYANAAFVRTSGFSADELAGQAHNIVRHPDMPVQAYADMWRSLKAGQAWTAVVKNRRMNGDHYWVRANVAPMRRNGELVGYISVRTKPSRAAIDGAERLYQRVRDGQAPGLAFHCGLVVRTGWMRFASAAQLLPAAWRVRLPMLAASVVLLGALLMSPLQGGTLAWVLAACMTALLLANVVIEAQIITPLKSLLATAARVASGDTGEALEFNRCDEIGMIARSINQAGLNLRSLVADVQEQAGGVRVASSEIAAASNDLSNRTEQSASSLEQTAAAMEQQTASVRQNSDTALQAATVVKGAVNVAERGGQSVTDVVATMGQISVASTKIADIISVIDGIAFQTNILALNAAVEAARAGEQGRGFAVVASEVRTLAGRSAAAAKEIKGLIDDSVKTVARGSKLVSDAGATMSEVVSQIRRVNDMIVEITSASREQSLGISQVSQAVAQLDQSTQQNAAMVEQSSAAAASLSEQAERLLDAIQVFSVEGGQGARALVVSD